MIPRRAFLASGPLALTACRATEGAYFGRTNPPDGQRLVAVLGVEPGSLDPATSAEPIEDSSSLPVYVRALEFLNAPFAAMPNALRESLGKIAILTLFNSIAVLVYVIIFRRH